MALIILNYLCIPGVLGKFTINLGCVLDVVGGEKGYKITLSNFSLPLQKSRTSLDL